jgi:DNA gyrase subunit A
VLIFSTRGKVYRLKVHELPIGSRHARGAAVVNILPFEQTEKIAAVINTKVFSPDEYLMFATKHGMVKKTAIQAYDRSRRDGIIAINLRDDDELISVRRVRTGENVMMVSTSGKAIKWSEAEARPMGRDTMGVKGMTVKEGDAILGMEIAPDNAELFVVTERGYGKRTPVNEYPGHHRGGQGVKTIQVTPRKGPLTGMKIVMPQHELMLISEEGVVIRVKADDISKLGRSTQGVKVMNVAETDRVSAIARVSGGKKKAPKARGIGDGQGSLLEQAEVPSETELPDEVVDETEDLMAEEFEDAEDAEATGADE